MKIEIYAESTTDLIKENLLNTLTTKQLIDFIMSLPEDCSSEEEIFRTLKKKIDKRIAMY